MDWDFREDSGMAEERSKGEEVGNDRAYVHRGQRACRYAYGLKIVHRILSCHVRTRLDQRMESTIWRVKVKVFSSFQWSALTAMFV